MMKIDLLADIQGKLWAITPEGAANLVHDAIDSRSVESRPPEKQAPVKVVNSVAIIPVRGALAKDYGWTGWYSGAHSGYLGIREQVETALADGSVKAILLNVDSPGGTVDGCKELTDFFSTAGKEKPIYTYANSLMASAAYWSCCVGKVVAAPPTAQVGSIGVRTLHADWSEYYKKLGITITDITAGEYKVEPGEHKPLSKKGLAYVKERVEQMRTLFAEDVAKHRNLSVQAVYDTEAKIYLAQDALDLGLIDRIEENIDTFLSTILKQEGITMDYATLKADHTALFDQVKKEGADEANAKAKADLDAAEAKTKTAADTAQGNVLALVKAVCGDEAHKKVSDLATAGVTADQAAAVQKAFGQQEDNLEDKDQASRQQILDGLHNAHSDGLPSGGGGDKNANPLLVGAQAPAGQQ